MKRCAKAKTAPLDWSAKKKSCACCGSTGPLIGAYCPPCHDDGRCDCDKKETK